MESYENREGVRALTALTVLIYLLALTILGSDLRNHFGFPLDDSWIHQSVGRNLAQFGSLGYLPHERSSGSTSLLWTLVLSSNYLLLPGLSPVLFTALINGLLICAIGVLLLRLALSDGMPPRLALIVAVAPALDGNYLWLAFTGMEHLLFMALSLASIWFWLAPSRQANGTGQGPLIAGVCMGLLGMTRPEGLALPLLLFTVEWLRAQDRTHSSRQTLMAGAICVVLTCVPFGVNLYTSRSLLPVTFQGRKWLLLAGSHGWSNALADLAEEWSVRPFKALAAFDGGGLSRLERVMMFLALGTLIWLLFLGVRSLIHDRRRLLSIVCGWGALHAILYLVILPGTGHGGRYQPFFLLLLLPLLALGLHQLVVRRAVAVKAVSVVLVLVIGMFSLSIWRLALADGIDHINRTHGVVSAWLEKHLPDEKVAVFDIGRIGYDRGKHGDPNIIDLGGLTDPGYIRFLYGRQVPDYLAQHGIRYVVLPVNPEGASSIARELGLSLNPQVAIRTLFRVCSPSADWQLSWSEFRNAFQCQEVDSVVFGKAAAGDDTAHHPRAVGRPMIAKDGTTRQPTYGRLRRASVTASGSFESR